MANLNNPDGSREQQRPEDYWTERFQVWLPTHIDNYGGHSFEFGRNFFKFKDKSGKTITVKISSK